MLLDAAQVHAESWLNGQLPKAAWHPGCRQRPEDGDCWSSLPLLSGVPTLLVQDQNHIIPSPRDKSKDLELRIRNGLEYSEKPILWNNFFHLKSC